MAKVKYVFTFLFSLLLFANAVQAQIIDPPKWTFTLNPSEIEEGSEAVLVLEAEIPGGWYIYANDFGADVGPILTQLEFDNPNGFSPQAELQSINSKRKFEEAWGDSVTYFIGKGRFEQKLSIDSDSGIIKGLVIYQMCSDLSGQCINFEEEFELTFGDYVADNPGDISTDTDSEDGGLFNSVPSLEEEKSPEIPFKDDTAERESLWGFMVLVFLAGLAALLTPCVFPMIPMTVSFFTGRSKTKAVGIRNASIYGFSIIAIYTVAGTLVAAIQGPEFANWLATHWIPNVFFFGIFIFFALAFLGLFELNLPSSFVNKIDQKAEQGGLLGVFFMAFTLVLVSFSCTGPIVGSILISSAGGELIKPVLGMFSFSLAFAIPFTLFAIFPEWMNRLPKSGGWLNSVKVVLGFLELALAFKFLSIADLVYHWGILDREIFLVIWIVVFFFLGLYLMGKIRLPHDSPMEKLGVPRLLLSMATFAFVVYMIPGLWGAPLKALSGYLPPITTQDFHLGSSSSSETTEFRNVKYGDLLKIPFGIQGYFDYDEALAAAKAEGKPLLIDFTGHGCVNCRKMEENVWSDPAVLQRLKENFVMVALYIDERLELPENEWYTSDYDGKVKKTMGKQNADFQITEFQNNAQPYYVILDHNEALLVTPRGYNSDIQEFIDYLDEASDNFEARK